MRSEMTYGECEVHGTMNTWHEDDVIYIQVHSYMGWSKMAGHPNVPNAGMNGISNC